MVNPQAVQYIQQQLSAGYAPAQIKQALLQNGYAPLDVEAAFLALQPKKPDAVVHEYAEGYARQGMTQEQTFQQLVGQGYDAGMVRRTLRDVYGAPPGSSHKTLLFVFLALVVGAGGMYLLNGIDNQPVPPGYPPIGGVPGVYSPSEIIHQCEEVGRAQGAGPALESCQSRLSGIDRDQCYHAIAVLDNVADDTICDRVLDATVHDACLINFLNEKFDSVCARVKLAESRDTCESIRALRG